MKQDSKVRSRVMFSVFGSSTPMTEQWKVSTQAAFFL